MRNLDPRQNGALRQGIVLGYAAGANWGRFWDGEVDGYPKDTAVIDRVLRDSQSFRDLYPALARVADRDEGTR